MGRRRRTIADRWKRIAGAAVGIALFGLGGAILINRLSHQQGGTAQIGSAKTNASSELRAEADLLARHPADVEVLTRLREIYARLCDPATQEPGMRSGGAAARQVTIVLRRELASTEGTAEQNLVLGQYALASGQNHYASDAFTKAYRQGIPEDDIIVPLALALLRGGDLQKALAAADPGETQSAAIKPLLWNLRGRIQLAMGDVAKARASFASALAVQPDNADAMARLGILELWHGDPPKAAALLDQLRFISPGSLATTRLRAEYTYATGDDASSADAYASLIQRGAAEVFDPIPPSLGYARALIYLGDIAQANRALAASPLDKRDPNVTYYRALLDYRAGDFQHAAELARAAERSLADYPPLNVLIGGATLAAGYPETAIFHLKRYLDAEPNNAAARSLLDAANARVLNPAQAPVLPDQLQAAVGFTQPERATVQQ